MNSPAALRHTFRRKLRLNNAVEFAAALRARPVLSGPHFQVYCSPTIGIGARLGIIVGKRFVARAVDRNKIKRLIREVFRTKKFQLPASDHVVRVKDATRSEDIAALRVEIEGLLGSKP